MVHHAAVSEYNLTARFINFYWRKILKVILQALQPEDGCI